MQDGLTDDPLDSEEQLQVVWVVGWAPGRRGRGALGDLFTDIECSPLAFTCLPHSPPLHPCGSLPSTPLQDQLDSLPYLFRFQYEKMAEALTSAADPLIAAYASRGAGGAVAGGAASSSSPPRDAAVLEGQLTWIVYMVGAVVRGRASASGADAQEAVDGDLAARVFGVLRAAEGPGHAARAGAASRRRLELALLSFLQSFRKVYIGEAVMHSSKVYVRLGESVGLADHAAVMNVILAKMASNLKVYCGAEEVISATLELFKVCVGGVVCGGFLGANACAGCVVGWMAWQCHIGWWDGVLAAPLRVSWEEYLRSETTGQVPQQPTPCLGPDAPPPSTQDLASGYMSSKLLIKLEAISYLLTHHTAGEVIGGRGSMVACRCQSGRRRVCARWLGCRMGIQACVHSMPPTRYQARGVGLSPDSH